MGLFDNFQKTRKCILVNKSMTVYLENGGILIFENSTKEHYLYCANQENTDDNIVDYFYNHRIEEKVQDFTTHPTDYQIIQKQEAVQLAAEAQEKVITAKYEADKQFVEKVSSLDTHPDFEVENNCYYLVINKNRINVSIPKELIAEFIKVIGNRQSEEYEALKKFWMWTCLCPNPESRQDLYSWVKTNGLKINKNGFFLAYRKVVSVESKDAVEASHNVVDKQLSEFISNSVLKIKAQKKGIKSYTVCRDSNSSPFYTNKTIGDLNKDVTVIGNLNTLYEGLSKTEDEELSFVQTYTDAHTGKMDIRIGKEVSLPADHCDWDNRNSCSSGLHIRSNKDHGCGDTTIVVMVNALNVVAVPTHDTTKMRVKAYFPVAVVTRDEDGKILDEIDTMEIAEEYNAEQTKELENLISTSKIQEGKRQVINLELPPAILKAIKAQVDPKEVLKKRVKSI